MGWFDDTPSTPSTPAPSAPPAPSGGATTNYGGAPDQWGRYPGHPEYGRAPGSAPSAGAQPFDQAKLDALLAGVDKNNWAAGLAAIEPQLNAMGIQVQKSSGGEVRGRLYLPNAGGDPYGRPLDPFEQLGWNVPAGSLGAAGGGGGGAQGQMQTELEMAPGFQFRLAEGQKAIERSAAAKGTLLTGGTMKALTRYAQNFASNEYNNRYNQLYGLSTLGLNAAGQSASSFGQQAGAGTDLITGGANANAAGTIGSANAWAQGTQGAAGAAQQAYWAWLLSQGTNPAGSGGGYGPGNSYPGPTQP